MYKSSYHSPIMVEEIEKFLQIKSDGIYYDGTLGGGGHSEMILSHLNQGQLIATDKDEDAIKFASERLKCYSSKLQIFKSDYINGDEVIKKAGYEQIDGALLDLGVSSFQLDNFERGFSYRKEEYPLDMRMDKSSDLSAYDVVNSYSQSELERILRDYGEERFHRQIAKRICEDRKKKSLETVGELVKIIREIIPASLGQKEGHPAKRVFQSIRIEVNKEIENLEKSIKNIARMLKVGGRMCVITFHSLEDRIIKNVYRELEADCVCDKSIPVCICNKKSEVKVITKKPVVASKEEVKDNVRAKPAKLRVIEKK